ncbi:hypothetical protein Lepto7375DRAFT_7224 [Leptolyngbya sp. PCC 7375]|nr:hypothetical protein Lepto7375DRAFT_7224 [Leptolyngbya sp. PCC 7375]
MGPAHGKDYSGWILFGLIVYGIVCASVPTIYCAYNLPAEQIQYRCFWWRN